MRRQPATLPAKISPPGCLVAIIGLLVGCGGSSPPPSTSAEARTSAGPPPASSPKDPCEPHQSSSEVEGPAATAGAGEATAIEIGDTKAALTLLRASSPAAIRVTYGEERKFEAPAGSILVAVTYRLGNRGPGELKPSEDVNSRMLLRVAGNFYPYAAALPCDVPITASWAVAQGGSNPAQPVPVGQSATTAVVFIAPKPSQEAGAALVVPGEVEIELPGIGS